MNRFAEVACGEGKGHSKQCGRKKAARPQEINSLANSNEGHSLAILLKSSTRKSYVGSRSVHLNQMQNILEISSQENSCRRHVAHQSRLT